MAAGKVDRVPAAYVLIQTRQMNKASSGGSVVGEEPQFKGQRRWWSKVENAVDNFVPYGLTVCTKMCLDTGRFAPPTRT
jgi:hypothetical protein